MVVEEGNQLDEFDAVEQVLGVVDQEPLDFGQVIFGVLASEARFQTTQPFHEEQKHLNSGVFNLLFQKRLLSSLEPSLHCLENFAHLGCFRQPRNTLFQLVSESLVNLGITRQNLLIKSRKLVVLLRHFSLPVDGVRGVLSFLNSFAPPEALLNLANDLV